MALDPDDRAALDIFRDPSISPEEKRRLLGAPDGGIPMPAPAPPELGGLPAGAVAGPGGGDPSDRAAIDAALSAPKPAAPGPAPAPASGIPTAPPAGGFISDPTVANKPGIAGAVAQLQSEGPQPNPEALPLGASPTGPGAGAPPALGGDDARSAIRAWIPPSTPVTPQEHVQQQTEVTGSGVGPEQIAALKAAAEQRDADTVKLSHAEAQQAYAAGNVKVAAEKQAQAERAALNATREQALARADQILAQQDKISQQIVNTQPLAPGEMASKNFGDALFTVLSVFGAVAGAGSPDQAADRVAKIANSEVLKQQADLEKKRGDVAQLDNLYSKHLANLKDHELAKTATIADIYGRAEAEIQSMIQSNGQAPNSPMNLKLAAEASDLAAKRQEFMTDIQAKLGPKIHQQEAVSFMRKHLEPKAPTAPGAPAPAAGPANAPTGGAVTVRAGGDTAPKPKGDPLAHARALWNSGDHRGALAALPPTYQAFIAKQAKRNEGEFKDRNDAIAHALEDHLGFQRPASLLDQSEREKVVLLPGGEHAFAVSKEHAGQVQEAVSKEAELQGAYNLLLRAAEKPASAWSPEERARIEATAGAIGPMMAHALGQRGMSPQEAESFQQLAGKDINGIRDFMLGTGKAAARQGLLLSQSRVRALRSSLSASPQDFVPLGYR